jgi:acetyl-CoA synthetase
LRPSAERPEVAGASANQEETIMPNMLTSPRQRAEELQARIEQLLDLKEFPPPKDFAERAGVRDPAVYEQAADAPAWWAEQARQRLDWQAPFSTVLDDSNPPFYSWFTDGR